MIRPSHINIQTGDSSLAAEVDTYFLPMLMIDVWASVYNRIGIL